MEASLGRIALSGMYLTLIHYLFLQIATMQKRLEQWTEDVSGMEQLLEVKAKDILT